MIDLVDVFMLGLGGRPIADRPNGLLCALKLTLYYFHLSFFCQNGVDLIVVDLSISVIFGWSKCCGVAFSKLMLYSLNKKLYTYGDSDVVSFHIYGS